MKKSIIAAVFVAALSLMPSGAYASAAPPPPAAVAASSLNLTAFWVVGGCAAGIIAAAAVASSRDHRELTAPEAWTCGLLFWFEPPMPKKPVSRVRQR